MITVEAEHNVDAIGLDGLDRRVARRDLPSGDSSLMASPPRDRTVPTLLTCARHST
jgi:hypothetical protein